MSFELEGGCLCGFVRYRLSVRPIDAGFCHCKLCQRSSGAPVLAWLTMPFTGFQYLEGEAAVFESSARYQREFCPRCGTQIAFRSIQRPATIDVTLCSLDEPERIAPQYHVWCQSKVSWLHLQDGLPHYEDAGPDVL